MDVHEPFDHQDFLPVAEALTARLFPAPEVKSPPTSEEGDLLRRAEARASGEELAAPAPAIQPPGVFVGDDLSAHMGANEGADIGGDELETGGHLRPIPEQG